MLGSVFVVVLACGRSPDESSGATRSVRSAVEVEASCPSAPASGPPARLLYTGAIAGEYADALALEALLVDRNSAAIANRTIQFGLGSQNATATTDANGRARAQLFPDTP